MTALSLLSKTKMDPLVQSERLVHMVLLLTAGKRGPITADMDMFYDWEIRNWTQRSTEALWL